MSIGGDVMLLNSNRQVCQICFSPLQRRDKYAYADPFVAPATWCAKCKLWWWEMTKPEKSR